MSTANVYRKYQLLILENAPKIFTPNSDVQQYLHLLNGDVGAFCALLGVVAASALTSNRLRRQRVPARVTLNILFWAIPFGIVGGRIYNISSHPQDYFYPGANLLSIVYVGQNNVSILGAVFIGSLGISIACHRNGIGFTSFADAAAPGALIAQALIRLGAYSSLTDVCFLYEAAWDISGATILLFVDLVARLRLGTGFGLYLILSGTGRLLLELFRDDQTEIGPFGIKFHVIVAVGAAVSGCAIIEIQRNRRRTSEEAPASTSDNNLTQGRHHG